MSYDPISNQAKIGHSLVAFALLANLLALTLSGYRVYSLEGIMAAVLSYGVAYVLAASEDDGWRLFGVLTSATLAVVAWVCFFLNYW